MVRSRWWRHWHTSALSFVVIGFAALGVVNLALGANASALDMEYPPDAVKSYQYYYAAKACAANSYSDDAVKDNKLDTSTATVHVGHLIDPSDADLGCDEVMPLAVGFWGYSGAAAALSDWGYRLEAGRWSLDLGPFDGDGASNAVSAALKRKFYGGKEPALSPEQLYFLYSQSFLVGCNATEGQKYADAPKAIQDAADSRTSDYIRLTLAVGSPAEQIDMIYRVDDPEAAISIVAAGVGATIEPDGELQCRTLASRASSNADEYVGWAKTHEEYNQQIQNLQGEASGNDDSAEDSSTCGFESNAMNWIACPVTELMQTFVSKMAEVLEGLLYFPTYDIFGRTESGSTTEKLREVWQFFRNAALAIIVIAGLIMVASEALGFSLLDAYTIRKLLPRLGIAMIGIAISWPLMQFVITLSNDAGTMIHSLLTSPFRDMPIANAGPTNTATNAGAVLLGVVVGVPQLYYLGFMGILSLLFSISMALLIGFVVLGIRWIIILLCLLAAPLAIAAYVLPGTQKLWAFWKNTLITTLLMFPIIMGRLSLGEVMARITSQMPGIPGGYFLVMVVYFGPFFLLPFLFKLAGGLMSTIFSLANDKSRGVFDRQRKFRQDSSGRRRQEYAKGLRGGEKSAIGNYSALREAVSDPSVGIEGVLSKSGRQGVYNTRTKRAAADAIKNAAHGTFDDDYALIIAQEADGKMTNSEWEEHYVGLATKAADKDLANGNITPETREKRINQARANALKARRVLEMGSGLKVGTTAMHDAAHHARAVSKTGFTAGREGMREAFEEAASEVKAGRMTALEAMGILKEAQRLEMSSISFGAGAEMIQDIADSNTGKMDDEQINTMFDSALQFIQPSQLAGARHETVRGIAEHLNTKVQKAFASGDQTKISRAIADVASIRDSINYFNSENSELFGTIVNSQPAGTTGVTIREYEERLRANSDSDFLDVRKEWANRLGPEEEEARRRGGPGPGQGLLPGLGP